MNFIWYSIRIFQPTERNVLLSSGLALMEMKTLFYLELTCALYDSNQLWHWCSSFLKNKINDNRTILDKDGYGSTFRYIYEVLHFISFIIFHFHSMKEYFTFRTIFDHLLIVNTPWISEFESQGKGEGGEDVARKVFSILVWWGLWCDKGCQIWSFKWFLSMFLLVCQFTSTCKSFIISSELWNDINQHLPSD